MVAKKLSQTEAEGFTQNIPWDPNHEMEFFEFCFIHENLFLRHLKYCNSRHLILVTFQNLIVRDI